VQGSDGGLLQLGDGRAQGLGARETRALDPYGMEPKCKDKLCTLDDRNEGASRALMVELVGKVAGKGKRIKR